MVETQKLFAFVLMPFDPAFEDIYRFGIKETAGALGILAERVDEQIYQEAILDRIYRQIELADIIIADMTGKNPNVFYEVGFAHAKGKLCILLTSESNDIPFDLKHRRHIVYGGSIANLRRDLASELAWAKQQLQNIRQSRIKVQLRPVHGDLTMSKYSATGVINFKVDLVNDSDKSSPEIEALYFYSTRDWSLSQDGKECASTDSDLPGFNKRHFLSPPLRRLQPAAWAQVVFSSKKTLAWALKGEELQDSYKVSGRSVLRLVTSEGLFDHELDIDVTLTDLPF
jgi:hypothetical protein